MNIVRALAASHGREATASQEKNAQRFTEKLFQKQDLSIPVNLQAVQHEVIGGHLASITTFHVTPEEWIRYLIQEDSSLLSGPTGDPENNFHSFWQAFRMANGDHKVFELHPDKLERVVPCFVHGDEGRGQKKSPYMVVSFESCLGVVPRRSPPCSCEEYLQSRPDLPNFDVQCRNTSLSPATADTCCGMHTSYRGHSFLSRHLLFGLRKLLYRDNPHVLDTLFQITVNSFKKLLHEGIDVPGHGRWFAAVAAFKGDMDFHLKSFELTRSYSHVQSRDQGYICHQCFADAGCNAVQPFDDFSEEPTWAQSIHASRPWAEPEPVLAQLPTYPAPEKGIVDDPLHVLKLGICRDVIGGVLLVLCKLQFFDYPGSTVNIVDRLARAHSNFSLYCSAMKEFPALRGFTKGWLHLKTFMSAPWCNSKGSDSMILLRWLVWFMQLNLKHPTREGCEPVLQTMLMTCVAIQAIFKILHGHGLWLRRPCASRLYIEMLRTLRGYRKCGQAALRMRTRAFILKPKCHALHHMAHAIKSSLQRGDSLVLSTEAHGCEPNEDFIGRVCRLSRRVGARVMDKRVLERYFLKKKALQRRHSKAKRP